MKLFKNSADNRKHGANNEYSILMSNVTHLLVSTKFSIYRYWQLIVADLGRVQQLVKEITFLLFLLHQSL